MHCIGIPLQFGRRCYKAARLNIYAFATDTKCRLSASAGEALIRTYLENENYGEHCGELGKLVPSKLVRHLPLFNLNYTSIIFFLSLFSPCIFQINLCICFHLDIPSIPQLPSGPASPLVLAYTGDCPGGSCHSTIFRSCAAHP